MSCLKAGRYPLLDTTRSLSLSRFTRLFAWNSEYEQSRSNAADLSLSLLSPRSPKKRREPSDDDLRKGTRELQGTRRCGAQHCSSGHSGHSGTRSSASVAKNRGTEREGCSACATRRKGQPLRMGEPRTSLWSRLVVFYSVNKRDQLNAKVTNDRPRLCWATD